MEDGGWRMEGGGGRATRGTEAGVGIRDFRTKRENAMATGSKEVREICDPANFPDSFDSPVPSILRPKRKKGILQAADVLRIMAIRWSDDDSERSDCSPPEEGTGEGNEGLRQLTS